MQIGLTSISLFYGKIRLKLIQKHGVAINVMATVARVTALKNPWRFQVICTRVRHVVTGQHIFGLN